jgi:hypothetical protein
VEKIMHKRIGFVLVFLLLMASSVMAQKAQKDKVQPTGTPVLWREPTDLESRNLFVGPGGEGMKPDISKVTFVRDQEGGGYSTNYRVKDGAGKTWVVKFGKEAQPETAAVRLMWALGYVTEVNYLVPCVHIEGAPEPKRGTIERCENNGYANVKFEARPEEVKRLETWQWANNPFSGTKEYKGMIVLMSLINNWDLKDDNNKILFVPGSNGRDELHYIISDLGATFGKTGGLFSRNRNSPESYAKSKFIEGIEDGRVRLAYSGKNSELFKNITVEEVRWIGKLLSRLNEKQISDAFRAANYSEEEVQTLTQAVKARISQLTNVA